MTIVAGYIPNQYGQAALAAGIAEGLGSLPLALE